MVGSQGVSNRVNGSEASFHALVELRPPRSGDDR
jgi:hypothetical protein